MGTQTEDLNNIWSTAAFDLGKSQEAVRQRELVVWEEQRSVRKLRKLAETEMEEVQRMKQKFSVLLKTEKLRQKEAQFNMLSKLQKDFESQCQEEVSRLQRGCPRRVTSTVRKYPKNHCRFCGFYPINTPECKACHYEHFERSLNEKKRKFTDTESEEKMTELEEEKNRASDS